MIKRIIPFLFALFFVVPSYATMGIVNPVGVILEENGGVPVNIQDQTTPPFDLYFVQGLGPPTTLAAVTAVGDTAISVNSVALISTGTYIGVVTGDPDEPRFYFAEVLAVAGTHVSVDTPLDFAFSVSDNVIATTRDLNVNGSVTSQVFEVQGPGTGSELAIDITRILIEITTDSAPPFDGFGNIAGGLTKGLVLRRVDGETRNTWNVKTNSEFANLAYDYTLLSGFGAAVDGLLVRYTFAGQDKHGVAVRLAASESLELLIQDDLTSLLSFRVIAAGHIVTD